MNPRHATCSVRALARTLLAAVVLLLAFGGQASADVLREGAWPEEGSVSLSADGVPRATAIQRLADAAGWSLVAEDLDDAPVHVQVKDQPPAKVLDLLLADGHYVAKREGTLVSLSAADAPADAPATSAVPIRVARPPPSASTPTPIHTDGKASKKGEDRVVTGDDVRIGRDEVVHDLFVWGGSVTIEGTVTGDVLILGGSGALVEGSYVAGDLVAFGASVDIANGAQVDGDVAVLGGSLHRGDQVSVNCTTCDDEPEEPEDPMASFFGKVLGNLTGMALLWVFGAMLLAIALRRVEVMQREIEARPWRCLALGMATVVGVLVIIGSLVITLIGIPLALIGGLLAGLAAYVGFCVVVLTTGSVLSRRRTHNVYAQLAFGCLAYFLVGLIPGVGGLVSTGIALVGLGALVATRGAGLLPPRKTPGVPVAPPPPPAPSGPEMTGV